MWRNRRKTRTHTGTAATAATSMLRRAAGPLPKSKVAVRRRKMRALLAAVLLVVVVCILGLFSWLSFLAPLTVTRIDVEGTNDIPKRAISLLLLRETEKPLFWLFSRQNVLLYPKAELESIVAYTFPKIESITIDTQPTQKAVQVTIRERDSYAQWCDTDGISKECYLLDHDGFVFEEIATTSTSTLLFTGGMHESRANFLRARVAPEYFQQVVTFISDLETLGLTVRSFAFLHDEARLEIEPGWELKIALDDDLGVTAFNLAAVLDTYHLRDVLYDVLYIDMRFGERVYHKLKSGTTDNEV